LSEHRIVTPALLDGGDTRDDGLVLRELLRGDRQYDEYGGRDTGDRRTRVLSRPMRKDVFIRKWEDVPWR
jgi:hypothetical protein